MQKKGIYLSSDWSISPVWCLGNALCENVGCRFYICVIQKCSGKPIIKKNHSVKIGTEMVGSRDFQVICLINSLLYLANAIQKREYLNEFNSALNCRLNTLINMKC